MSCNQWFKDTNLKANHNDSTHAFGIIIAVINGSKIQV